MNGSNGSNGNAAVAFERAVEKKANANAQVTSSAVKSTASLMKRHRKTRKQDVSVDKVIKSSVVVGPKGGIYFVEGTDKDGNGIKKYMRMQNVLTKLKQARNAAKLKLKK